MFDDLICAFYNNRSLIDHTLKKLTETEEFKKIIINPVKETS